MTEERRWLTDILQKGPESLCWLDLTSRSSIATATAKRYSIPSTAISMLLDTNDRGKW